MKPLCREWVVKAEGDFDVMERESRVRKRPNHDAVCFHAHQRAEKYLKARLCEANVAFPKTHELVRLLDLALSIEPFWETYRGPLSFLSSFAVVFRYPGESADRERALEARIRCRHFRNAARQSLGLKV